MRGDAYSDLMALAWMIGNCRPNDWRAALTKAELQQELPQAHIDREKREQRGKGRADSGTNPRQAGK